MCTHISEKIWEEQILSQISKVLNRSVSDSIYSTPSITFATRSLSTEVLYIAWNSLMLLGTLGQKLHSWLIFQGWHCYCWAAWDRSSSVILNFPSHIQQQLIQKKFPLTGFLWFAISFHWFFYMFHIISNIAIIVVKCSIRWKSCATSTTNFLYVCFKATWWCYVNNVDHIRSMNPHAKCWCGKEHPHPRIFILYSW